MISRISNILHGCSLTRAVKNMLNQFYIFHKHLEINIHRLAHFKVITMLRCHHFFIPLVCYYYKNICSCVHLRRHENACCLFDRMCMHKRAQTETHWLLWHTAMKWWNSVSHALVRASLSNSSTSNQVSAPVVTHIKIKVNCCIFISQFSLFFLQFWV